MKKVILVIAIIALGCSAFAQDSIKAVTLQTKILKARTAIQEEEIARMEYDFVEINPDTLDSKKPVIYIAKDDSSVFCYLKVKTKYYRIDWFDANLDMKEMIYNLRQEGDSLILFGNKGVKLISIQ